MNNRRNTRENTFRVDFGGIPKKPTSEELHFFVGRHLGVTREQLVRIQIGHVDDCAFVKVTERSIAEQIVQTHDNKHNYIVKGEKYPLRIRMAERGVEVILHDLTEHITGEQIYQHMSSYGEVISVKEILWSDKHHFPGSPTGKWQVMMVLREHIKSYISIEGESTWVTYPKQRQTCRHCAEYMHIGISCVQNKKLLAQKISVNDRLRPNSYAGALRGFNKNSSHSTINDRLKMNVETQNFPELAPISPPDNPLDRSDDITEAIVSVSADENLRSKPSNSYVADPIVQLDDGADKAPDEQLNRKKLGINHSSELNFGDKTKDFVNQDELRLIGLQPRPSQSPNPTSRNVSRSPIRSIHPMTSENTTSFETDINTRKSSVQSDHEQVFSTFSMEESMDSSDRNGESTTMVSTSNFSTTDFQSGAQVTQDKMETVKKTVKGKIEKQDISAMLGSDGYTKVKRPARSKSANKQNKILKR